MKKQTVSIKLRKNFVNGVLVDHISVPVLEMSKSGTFCIHKTVLIGTTVPTRRHFWEVTHVATGLSVRPEGYDDSHFPSLVMASEWMALLEKKHRVYNIPDAAIITGEQRDTWKKQSTRFTRKHGLGKLIRG